MKPRASFLAMLALLGAAVPANAGLIANYTFTGSSSAATSVDPLLTASTFQDGDGSLNLDAVNGNPAPSAYKTYNDMPTSFNTAAWLGFDVTPILGATATLQQLIFDAERDPSDNGNDGKVTIEVRASTNGFSTSSTLGSFSLIANSGNWSVDLTQALSQVTGLTYSLRFYLHDNGSTQTNAGFHLDNVELYGTVSGPHADSVTPEPGSMALCAIGSGLAFFGQKLRRRRQPEQPI